MRTWAIDTAAGPGVRLSGLNTGFGTIDATAPVRGGTLHVSTDTIELSIILSLSNLRTGNFLMQAAARAFISRWDADELRYTGRGPAGPHWQVSGHARAGTVELQLDLLVVPQPGQDAPSGIQVTGRGAPPPDADVSLPVIGRVDDLSFDVDARLPLIAE